MGVTEQLARFAIDTPSGFLTPELTACVQSKFLDTLGIMVAGAQAPSTRLVLAMVQESGGTPQSAVIGTPHRTSVSSAGFVNGVAAHALEYDDNTPDIGHVSACMVPGCIAVAEKLGLGGREVVEAFALGYEVAARVSVGLKPAMFDRGWHSPGMIGGLGVAIAAARLYGLDAEGARMAMGLMASSGTGIRKNVGSAGKAFHIGNGVRAGLTAAALAARGYKVDPDIIEGQGSTGHQRFGLADVYSGPQGYSLERMVQNLNTRCSHTLSPTMVRMHPGSTVSGAAIDGIIAMAKQHDLRTADVEEIRVDCHPRMLVIASYAEPSDTYRAKFCPPYTFAAAFIDRKVGLAQYSEQRIRSRDVLDFMQRVKVVPRGEPKQGEGWGSGEHSWGAVAVAIRLKNGKTLSGKFADALGWPGNPASWDDLRGKYEDCVAGILSPQQLRESVDMTGRLAQLGSLRELVQALTPAISSAA